MSDRLAKLQAERAALEAEIRAEKRLQTHHRGEEGAALYAAIGCAIREARRDRDMSQRATCTGYQRSAARSGYVARATCTGYQLCAHLDCEH